MDFSYIEQFLIYLSKNKHRLFQSENLLLPVHCGTAGSQWCLNHSPLFSVELGQPISDELTK